MAPKKGNPSPAAVPPSASKPTHAVSTAASGAASQRPATKASMTDASHPSSTSKPSSSSTSGIPSNVRNAQDAQQIVVAVWNNYVDKTPQRVKLLDAFMVFLMVVGMLQFAYCVIAGNYVSQGLEDIGQRQGKEAGQMRLERVCLLTSIVI